LTRSKRRPAGRLSTRLWSKLWVSPSIQCRVLEDHDQGLDVALAQQQTLDRVKRLLAPLMRIESMPGCLLHGHVEEREEGGGKDMGERQDLPRYPLPDLPRVVAALKLEVAAKEIEDRKIGGGLTVGDRSGLNDQRAAHTMGVVNSQNRRDLQPGSLTTATT
jgi:hypothetical protein